MGHAWLDDDQFVESHKKAVGRGLKQILRNSVERKNITNNTGYMENIFSPQQQELSDLAKEWDKAIVANVVSGITMYMSDD